MQDVPSAHAGILHGLLLSSVTVVHKHGHVVLLTVGHPAGMKFQPNCKAGILSQ